MKNVKDKKGITLVALIITVVILLILATVTISLISEQKIILYAKGSAMEYKEKEEQQNQQIKELENTIKDYNNDFKELKEGQKVKYDCNKDGTMEEWIVLSNRNGNLEIISCFAMGSLTLGCEDTSVSVESDLDGNGTIGNDVDKAIASYNNAIKRINDYCKTIVTAKDNDGVRSVGASKDTSGLFDPSKLIYEAWNEKIGDVKDKDYNYKSDLEKMNSLGIVGTTDDKTYWIASRDAFAMGDSRSFGVFFGSKLFFDYYGQGYENSGWMFHIDRMGTGKASVGGYRTTHGVRPIVLNPVGIEYIKN